MTKNGVEYQNVTMSQLSIDITQFFKVNRLVDNSHIDYKLKNTLIDQCITYLQNNRKSIQKILYIKLYNLATESLQKRYCSDEDFYLFGHIVRYDLQLGGLSKLESIKFLLNF